jgi:hypothetical protein
MASADWTALFLAHSWTNFEAWSRFGCLFYESERTAGSNSLEEMHSTDIRELRRQVEGPGATLNHHGSQWVLYGRDTEPLGHSIKTERDALEFVSKLGRKTR